MIGEDNLVQQYQSNPTGPLMTVKVGEIFVYVLVWFWVVLSLSFQAVGL